MCHAGCCLSVFRPPLRPLVSRVFRLSPAGLGKPLSLVQRPGARWSPCHPQRGKGHPLKLFRQKPLGSRNLVLPLRCQKVLRWFAYLRAYRNSVPAN